jgi:hypothetical protein
MPLFLVAILVFALGAITGWFCAQGKSRRLYAQLKAEQKRVAALQNQFDAAQAEHAPVAVTLAKS